MKTIHSFLQILTFTTLLAISAGAQSFLTNGLVAYYPFNGNANDASGNGNNGTVYGATLTTDQFGLSNSAYYFDGVSNYILVSNTPSLSLTSLTLSVWIKPAPGFSVPAHLLSKHQANDNYDGSWFLDIEKDVQSHLSFQGTPYFDAGTESISTAPTNAWCHYVFTYDNASNNWAFYLNGQLDSSGNRTYNLQPTAFPLRIGVQLAADGVSLSDFYHGALDNIRIYNRALSASEVQQLYQDEAVPPVITAFAPASGPVGTNVTITGLNFSQVASNDIVYFGAEQAAVTAASPTNLIVTIPAGATFAPITVTVGGLTAYSDQAFLPTFSGFEQISPSSLGSQIVLPTGTGPQRAVIADLDKDGRPDLVIADAYAGDISIYRNISSNRVLAFAPRAVLPDIHGSISSPFTVAVADLDGDGKLDIVALNADSNVVSIFPNTSTAGNISFAPRIDLPGGNTMRGLAVQDLNGDGKPDIVTANYGGNTISIFQNQSTLGSISFATRVDLAAGNGPTGVAIGDLDGDGAPDIATANFSDGTVSVFRNLGGGAAITTNSFAPQVTVRAANQCFAVTIGDVDGDGKPDMLVAGNSGILSVYRNSSNAGGITTNSFAPPVNFALAGRGHTIALGDLDGDGRPDIAVVTELNSALSVFPNQSAPGNFTTNSLGNRIDFATGNNAWGVSIGDLNGDGKPDVVFANQYDNTISVYLNSMLPSITGEPQDAYVNAYGTASFSVTAAGASAYQWLFNGSNVLNVTSNVLILSNIVQSDLGQYSAIAANSYGAVTSSVANLYMYPSIINPFTGLVTDWGQSNTLSVLAWGSGSLTYQWYDNGVAIPNETNSILTFSSIQFTNAGSYSVVISSSLGSVTNAPAQVVVNPAGVSLGLYPGVTITGTVGYTYNIQSNPDLSNSNGWTTVATLTLSQPTQLWIDVNNNAASPTNQHRFYRVVPGS